MSSTASGVIKYKRLLNQNKYKTATELAYAEVISYNRKNLERELQNESRQHNRQQGRNKQREEEI